MTTINLYKSSSQADVSAKTRAIDSGFWMSISMLVLVLGAWGFSEFYVKTLEKKSLALDQQVSDENSKGLSEDLDDVADLNERKKIIESKTDATKMNSVLSSVASTLVRGASVSGFKFESGNVAAEFRVPSFIDVARQTSSLKSKFNNVVIGEIKKEENVVVFSSTFSIK